MPSKISAGLLPYRKTSNSSLEVLLAHYGGPLWARKDLGAWTVIKGEIEPSSVIVSPPKVDVAISLEARNEIASSKTSRNDNSTFTDELLLQNAKREFREETGVDVSSLMLSSPYEGEDEGGVKFISLGEIIQRGGKTVHAWAFLFRHPEPAVPRSEAQASTTGVEGLQKRIIEVHSNTFEMEWPPRSGKIQQFPEIDKAEWFALDVARQKINPAQVAFLERLVEWLQRPV